MGLVRDRIGCHIDALPVCRKAYEFYRDRANGAPASLQAKAGISCAKIHVKLQQFSQAEDYIAEAVSMYEVTCGPNSPLTASAYHELGEVLWKQRKRTEAQKALKRAYEIESIKDAWDLVTLLEIHNLLMDTHLKECNHIDRLKFQEYFKIVEDVTCRVKNQLPQDGNAAVYYKAAAELKAWGGQYQEAKDLFDMAMPLLEVERSADCSGLLQACKDMRTFCDRNLTGAQSSPMDFNTKSIDTTDSGETCAIDESAAVEEVFEDAVEPFDLNVKCRAITVADHAALVRFCETRSIELLLDKASFARHVIGSGVGLCWLAEKSDTPQGFALCGSDGVFGQLLQLIGGDVAQRVLIQCCVDATLKMGLRALRALGATVSEASGKLLVDLGWQASRAYMYRREDVYPQKKSKQRIRFDVVAEDNKDSAVLVSLVHKFGIPLEPATQINKFAWDQNGRFVIINVAFDNLREFGESTVECLFKLRSILLLVHILRRKTHWFAIPNLCQNVDVEGSVCIVRTASVSIKLRKAVENNVWSDLTDKKDQYIQRQEKCLKDGSLKGVTTELLLEKMYEDATVEDRKCLRKAMHLNREKHAKEGRCL